MKYNLSEKRLKDTMRSNETVCFVTVFGTKWLGSNSQPPLCSAMVILDYQSTLLVPPPFLSLQSAPSAFLGQAPSGNLFSVIDKQ